MTWIRTIPFTEADDELRQAMEEQKPLYPEEYTVPIHPAEGGGSLIIASHSLIPQALKHAFSTFGALMSPDLPLPEASSRNDCHHGLGDQPVRVLNRVPRRVSASRHLG